MGFTDNFLVNGSGVDLAVFEVSGSGSPGATGCSVTLSLTKNSTKITKTPIWTNAVYYVAKYDLSEFGVASGGLISDFFIWGNSGDPEYTVFGAMNNTNVVPVPGSLMLLGSGLVAVAGLKPWRSRNLR
jgi:hypothetical protein